MLEMGRECNVLSGWVRSRIILNHRLYSAVRGPGGDDRVQSSL